MKFSIYLIKHNAIKTYVGVELQLHAYLTSVLSVIGEVLASAALPPWK
jgi:hypothetical protein